MTSCVRMGHLLDMFGDAIGPFELSGEISVRLTRFMMGVLLFYGVLCMGTKRLKFVAYNMLRYFFLYNSVSDNVYIHALVLEARSFKPSFSTQPLGTSRAQLDSGAPPLQ